MRMTFVGSFHHLVLLAFACPAFAQPVLVGAGATFPQPIYTKWFQAYAESHPEFQIRYEGGGSEAGIRLLAEGSVDFAASDMPLDDGLTAAGPQARQIVIDNFSFTPRDTMVSVGAMVAWTNRDDVPHNVISTEKKFASPVLDTDEQFSHRFDAPGTYPYYCSIHPKMTAQIVVG